MESLVFGYAVNSRCRSYEADAEKVDAEVMKLSISQQLYAGHLRSIIFCSNGLLSRLF